MRISIFLCILLSLNSYSCEEVSIPKKVSDYIARKNLPLTKSAMQFPAGYADAPGYEIYKCQIEADFNGDKVEDYAAFLFDTSKNGAVPILFVSTPNGYQHQLISTRVYQPNQLWAGLYVLNSGEHWHWDEKIKLENPGIGYQVFEKPCCRYYWNDNGLKELENDG